MSGRRAEVAFLHVMKTGGMTMRRVLASVYGEGFHVADDPDLDAMAMYGVTFSFKDSFDVMDMRSTGGGDCAYDIDFPAGKSMS